MELKRFGESLARQKEKSIINYMEPQIVTRQQVYVVVPLHPPDKKKSDL